VQPAADEGANASEGHKMLAVSIVFYHRNIGSMLPELVCFGCGRLDKYSYGGSLVTANDWPNSIADVSSQDLGPIMSGLTLEIYDAAVCCGPSSSS
jgi:hypothetical protein